MAWLSPSRRKKLLITLSAAKILFRFENKNLPPSSGQIKVFFDKQGTAKRWELRPWFCDEKAGCFALLVWYDAASY